MADMDERLELNFLLDFYGPLLTNHRREVMKLYCEEDLTLSEIGIQLGITRQAASDAVINATRKLHEYEVKLGLVNRYRALTEEAQNALAALDKAESDREALTRAREALNNILLIER